MKISESTSFPHPILAPWSSDIAGAMFDTTITFREEGDGRQVALHCETVLENQDITKLIEDGAASFGVYIKCVETGTRRIQQFGFPSGAYEFAPGVLLGRVQLRPMVWSTGPISKYKPEGTHAEFSKGIDIGPGEILALGEEQIIEVTRPPLPLIESIFEIKAVDGFDEGRFEINTDLDRITVFMGQCTFQLVQQLRETSRSVIMNSLYVPMIMQVLSDLSEGTEGYEQYRWFHSFKARCEMLDVDLEHLDLLNDAQRLLGMPFASLGQLVDFEEGLRP